MEELIQHLKEEKFTALKIALKKCQTTAEQRALLDGIESKRLTEFLAWLQADGAATGSRAAAPLVKIRSTNPSLL